MFLRRISVLSAALSASILALILVLTPARSVSAGETALVVPPVALQAPPLKLRGLDGKEFALGAVPGRVTVVNFWALWCAPCIAEMGDLDRLQEKLAGQNLDVIAVNLGDPPERIRRFLQEKDIDALTVLLEENGVAEEWQVSGLPVTYVVAPSGQVAFAALGSRDWDAGPIAEILRNLATGS